MLKKLLGAFNGKNDITLNFLGYIRKNYVDSNGNIYNCIAMPGTDFSDPAWAIRRTDPQGNVLYAGVNGKATTNNVIDDENAVFNLTYL